MCSEGREPRLWLRPLAAGSDRRSQSRAARAVLAEALRALGHTLSPDDTRLDGLSLRRLVLERYRYHLGISHCRGWVAVVLARSPVGVDCEAPGRRRDWLALAEAFFSAAEAAELRALPVERRERAFLFHWTLKEACLKAHGGSVFGDLNRLCLRRGEPWLAAGPDVRGWAWSALHGNCALGLYGAGEAAGVPRVMVAGGEGGGFAPAELPGRWYPSVLAGATGPARGGP